MQAKSIWSPPSGPLGRLSERARVRALSLVARRSDLESAVAMLDVVARRKPRSALLPSLQQGDRVRVIAEVKRRSPSRGIIDGTLRAASRATLYVEGGAAAISVLTEPSEFGGREEDLIEVGAAVDVPTIKKDFHVEPLQLLEARALGATAALLIARALAPSALSDMHAVAMALGLETIVEVRTEEELATALGMGAGIIGVNSRDLETLEVSAATLERLIPLIPRDRVAIAESGVMGVAEVARAARLGADAVLVGSVLSASPDPVATVVSLCGVARETRGR